MGEGWSCHHDAAILLNPSSSRAGRDQRIHAFEYARIHARIYACMYTSTYACKYARMNDRKYACSSACLQTCNCECQGARKLAPIPLIQHRDRALHGFR